MRSHARARRVFLFPIATVVFGTALGIVSRWLRPYANISGVHYEALASLAALLFGCLVLVYVNRRHHGRLGHLLYQLENLAMWSGFLCGWSCIHGEFWDDMVSVSIGWWVACCVFGSLLLSVIQRIPGHETAA
ncbi:MAG: hypothetical protein AAGJ83_13205 [Planctomycetota bacterium]